jgi:hypothetical protein
MDNMDNIDNIEYIQKYISINENTKLINRKQKGEVFTPYEIIVKMLKELENRYFLEHKKSIYSNKNLKWLDNCCGIGNFIIVIYFKLNIGLKNVILNEETRKKHILENMLYMSELDKNNLDKCINFLNPEKKFKLNINYGDSLNLNLKNTWNIDNVDIIIGNPPYQKHNKTNNNSRGGINNNLYIDFIKYSLSILNIDGYLVYIHPQNWRKIDNTILIEFLKYRLEFIGLNYGGKLFKNVSVKTDFYVLRKTLNDNIFKTLVESYDNKNKLILTDNFKINNSITFIPKYYSTIIQSIINKITTYGENKICIINSYCHKIRTHVSHIDNKTNEHIYPLYNTSANPFNYISSKKHYDQNKKKVILSCSGKLSPLYDNGIYGTTQDSMYIIVNSDIEGKQLVEILNTDLYIFLINICQWGNFRNEQKLFSYLKYPKITNSKIDNDYVNNYFNLTTDEIGIFKIL